LQQITAKVGDLHTRVSWRRDASFPIMFTQVGEVVFVSGVLHENMQHLLGMKLVGIEDRNISEVLTLVDTLISTENKYARKALAPSVLRDGDALHFLRISKSSESVTYKLEAPNKVLEAQLHSLKISPHVTWHRTQVNSLFSRSRPSEIYWYEHLRASQAIYINYSRCEERKDFPFQSLVTAVDAILSKEKVESVIIDLRFNPTGQKPNAFGEVKSFHLPNSRIEVHHSTKYWTRIKGSDPDALYPDVPVEMTFHQYTQGIDPVLQKALTIESER